MHRISTVMENWTLDKVVGAGPKMDEVKGFKPQDAVAFEMTKMVVKIRKF